MADERGRIVFPPTVAAPDALPGVVTARKNIITRAFDGLRFALKLKEANVPSELEVGRPGIAVYDLLNALKGDIEWHTLQFNQASAQNILQTINVIGNDANFLYFRDPRTTILVTNVQTIVSVGGPNCEVAAFLQHDANGADMILRGMKHTLLNSIRSSYGADAAFVLAPSVPLDTASWFQSTQYWVLPPKPPAATLPFAGQLIFRQFTNAVGGVTMNYSVTFAELPAGVEPW